MGAISALMAIGLFEVTGGACSGRSTTSRRRSSTSHDRAQPRLLQGRAFRIVTHGAAGVHPARRLDGSGSTTRGSGTTSWPTAGAGPVAGREPNRAWGVARCRPRSRLRASPAGRCDRRSRSRARTRVRVPYESVEYDAAFTPSDTSLKEAFWTVTEPDGSPTDKAKITNSGKLTVNHRAGAVRITATAADSGRREREQARQLDLDVALLRSNASRWPGVTVTASSESSGFPACGSTTASSARPPTGPPRASRTRG